MVLNPREAYRAIVLGASPQESSSSVVGFWGSSQSMEVYHQLDLVGFKACRLSLWYTMHNYFNSSTTQYCTGMLGERVAERRDQAHQPFEPDLGKPHVAPDERPMNADGAEDERRECNRQTERRDQDAPPADVPVVFWLSLRARGTARRKMGCSGACMIISSHPLIHKRFIVPSTKR